MALNDYLLGRLVLPEDEALYESTRVSLRRRKDQRAVDVYEMYWADLSRLGKGGLHALSALYQLFFHLSTLAADVVDQVSLAQARRSGVAPPAALPRLGGVADEGADRAAAAADAADARVRLGRAGGAGAPGTAPRRRVRGGGVGAYRARRPRVVARLVGLAALGQAGRAARGRARQRRRGVLRARSRGMGAAAVLRGRSGRGHIAGRVPGRALLRRHARRARARPPGGRRGRGRALRRRRAAARERDDAVRMDGHGGAQRGRMAARRRIARVGGIRPGADRRLAARRVARPRRATAPQGVAPHRAARRSSGRARSSWCCASCCGRW